MAILSRRNFRTLRHRIPNSSPEPTAFFPVVSTPAYYTGNKGLPADGAVQAMQRTIKPGRSTFLLISVKRQETATDRS